ncbi:MAG: ATP-binding protein [Desulfovibrionaceae bacterium]
MDRGFHFRKLAHRLAFCVFAVGVAATVCSAAFLVHRAYTNGVGEVEARFDDIEGSYTEGLANSLWVMDKELLRAQVEGIARLPFIAFARVTTVDGGVVEAGTAPRKAGLERGIPLVYVERGEDVPVGELHVVADMAVLNANLQAMVVDILLEQGLESFGISLIVFFLFYFMVGRHLRVIADYAATLTPQTLETPLHLSRRDKDGGAPDELDMLVSSLNVMRESLQRAMHEVRHSEERYRALFETVQQGMMLLDAAGVVTDINPAAQDILGMDSGRIRSRTLPVRDWQAVDKDGVALADEEFPTAVARRTGRAVRNVVLGLVNDREEARRWILVSAMPQPPERDRPPYPVHATFVDITELRRLQEMLIQTEKMHSIGSLAAGMAHEINNPLSSALQAAQNLKRRLSPDQPGTRQELAVQGIAPEKLRAFLQARKITSYVDGITEASLRAATIVRSMLDFSRRSDGAVIPCDLNQLLDRVVDLASKDYDLGTQYDFKTIDIERDYDRTLPFVPCRATEIEQVVLNCVVNAAHAMAGQQGAAPCLVLRSRREGDWAVLVVEDNGPGMPQAVKSRIFEPFFTTKGPGVGTGLGLSVAYFIITRNHGGEVEVQSEPGKGTRCLIRLPVAPRPGGDTVAASRNG